MRQKVKPSTGNREGDWDIAKIICFVLLSIQHLSVMAHAEIGNLLAVFGNLNSTGWIYNLVVIGSKRLDL